MKSSLHNPFLEFCFSPPQHSGLVCTETIKQETHHFHPLNPFTQNRMFISHVIEDKCKTNKQLVVQEVLKCLS